MAWLISKYIITAGIVVLLSEIVKRSEKFGALLTALPIIALLTMFWLYVEHQPNEKIGQYAVYTFWYVLPTLPMFLLFPFWLHRVGFWGAIVISILITIIAIWLLALLLKPFGIILL
ncbi:DUF3147 family protein [Methylophaga sp. OBS3]|uniref:DUF3147 family protein n=1 Tax=Methylophaga sp. OBS3 TaxID=2991934 RepID=UPI00225ACA2A|nr:DUF3147 family protein [Methylophaga sp. OBS3]MCX4188952.1 DUF3147 family protein [Methylophaga sp. OBS3]